jgi:hypothetical protein
VAQGAHVLGHPVMEGPVGDYGVGEEDLHQFTSGGMIPQGSNSA